MTESEVKKIVEREISNQLKPLHEWQLSFWSNGSGRPLGFFQMRMREDDERYRLLIKYQEEQKQELMRQSEVADRMDDELKAQANDRTRKKERWDRWWPIAKWVGGGIGTLALGGATWLTIHAVPIAHILWEDYLHYHPSVTQQLKNVGEDVKPDYTGSKRSPEESKIPPLEVTK